MRVGGPNHRPADEVRILVEVFRRRHDLIDRAGRVEIVAFDSAEEMFPSPREPVDALLLTAERGSAWTLLHPEFSIVVPMPGRIQVPLAYPVADLEMARFVDTWIDLVRKDGTIQELYDYWILGRTARGRAPRWSIVRNVLHWVD